MTQSAGRHFLLPNDAPTLRGYLCWLCEFPTVNETRKPEVRFCSWFVRDFFVLSWLLVAWQACVSSDKINACCTCKNICFLSCIRQLNSNSKAELTHTPKWKLGRIISRTTKLTTIYNNFILSMQTWFFWNTNLILSMQTWILWNTNLILSIQTWIPQNANLNSVCKNADVNST